MNSPASLSAKLGLPEHEVAWRLRVPQATRHDRERGLAPLDPAARALLDLVVAVSERGFRTLGTLPAAAEWRAPGRSRARPCPPAPIAR